MCNNGLFNFGGNTWWIIILILILFGGCGCENNACGCNNGCNHGCGCGNSVSNCGCC